MSFAKRLRRITAIIFVLSIVTAQSRDEVVELTYPVTGSMIDTNFVDVEITVADFFTLGSPGCSDCDGYVQITMDGTAAGQFTSDTAVTVTGLSEGSHFIEVEALDPSGASFSTVVYDSATFTVDMVSVPNICPARNLSVVAGDAQNILSWDEPSNIVSYEGFIENFNIELPTDWTVVDGGTTTDSWFWTNDYNGNTLDGTPFVMVDSDAAGSGTIELDEELITPILNTQGSNELYLSFDQYFNELGQDIVYIDVWDGSLWINVFTWTDDDLGAWNAPDHQNIDISDYANSELQIRFRYIDGGSWAWWWALDNIMISSEAPVGRTVYTYTLTEFGWDMSQLSKEDLINKYSKDLSVYSIVDESTIEEHIISLREDIPSCGNLQGYDLYRDGSIVVSLLDTNYYVDDAVILGTEYCYYVKVAYEAADGSTVYSDSSNHACGTPETFTPEPITNLNALGLDEKVVLSWTSPGSPSYVYYTSFEGSDAGFSGSGGFVRGIPTVGPDAAGSGLECWATNLDGEYDNQAFATLTSPVYDLTSMNNPMMQINHWYNIETYWDGGNVKISDDSGATWNVLTPIVDYPEDATSTANAGIPGEPGYTGTNSGNFWHTVQFDLSNYNSSTVMFRFDFGSDGSVTYEGWYIDDLAIFENSTSRENDGDLTHYNIYQDGVLVEDSVEVTGYVATGLTNATTYTFSVSAAYYPNYESDTVSVSATPTWLYGDVTGTITDPNGTPLDSTIVSTGDFSDTTGSDGTYFLGGLDPGDHTIRATRSGFDWVEADVTVIAQDAAVTADIVLIPSLMVSNGLEATAGDETIHLIWNKPGTMSDAELTGEWTLFYDWGCTGSPGNVDVEFTEDGGFYAYGYLQGGWVAENNSIDLALGGCDALLFEYNAYFYFDGSPTLYYMYVEENVFTGVISSGYGGHDGDNYGIRLTAAAMREVETFDEANIAGMVDLIIGAENVDENEDAARMIKKNGINQVFSNSSAFHARSSREDSLIGYNVYQLLTAGDTLVTTTTSGDDTTATITVPTNYVEYCYYVKARWNTDNYGILESKASDPACEVPFRSGDIDFNDAVDVSDLLSVVDFILLQDIPTEAEFRNADVNMDETISINDVVLIVDLIYGTNARTIASTDVPVLVDLLNADQQLLISLDYEGLTRGIQFTLDADASLEFGSPLLTVSDNGTMVASNRAEDGTVSVVVVNTSGGTVERAEDVLVRIPYTFKGNRRDKAVVELKDLKAAGMAGEALPVTIREKRIDISVVPSVFALHQNYPNPFNPVTEIQFDVPVESKVKLTIYNIMGQEVTTLSNSTLEAGFHSVRWDGTNGLGEQVSTGVYFYRLSSPAFTSIKKMIMVK